MKKRQLNNLLVATGVLLLAIISCTQNRSEAIRDVFPRGDVAATDHFTGKVWSSPLVTVDSMFNYSASNVTFSSGARTRYHRHEEGQILLCTAGCGWYKERGKAARKLHSGDVVKIPAHVEHWHGAAKDCEFSHLSLIPHQKGGTTQWLESVSEDEYEQLK